MRGKPLVEPWDELNHGEKAARYKGVAQMVERVLDLVPDENIRYPCSQILANVTKRAAMEEALAELEQPEPHATAVPFQQCGELCESLKYRLVMFQPHRANYVCLTQGRVTGEWVVSYWDHIKNRLFSMLWCDNEQAARDEYENRLQH